MERHVRTLCRTALLAALTTPAIVLAQAAADAPSVTPYRPSVSTPAALSAPGWLEVEAGVASSKGPGPERRASLPYTLKLAFTEDWGIRLGGDARVRQRDGTGARVSGGGDASVVLKRRFEVNDKSAFGLEAGATLAHGSSDISSGKTDYSINGIYSADIGQFHTDVNLLTTRLGSVSPGEGRNQLLWAASLSTALNDRWGIVGELSGTRQSGVPRTSQVLGAVSYNWSRSLTLDVGLSRSQSAGQHSWSVFTGFTLLAGKLL